MTLHTKNRHKSHIGRRVDKQGSRHTVRNQAVCSEKLVSGTRTQKLNILQLNICGIKNKKTELANLLHSKQIHVALIQESLHKDIDLHITGYTPYPCKCTDCRGIVTYIRNDQHGETENLTQSALDLQRTTLWHNKKKFTLYNVYNPPPNACNLDIFSEPEYQHTILAGDFNGHSTQWGYARANKTGSSIEELCGSTNLVVLQDENSTPTLLHRAHNTLSRPDLTILSADLFNKQKTEVLDGIGSDHRPILTTIDNGTARSFPRKTRWNFKKANWELFKTTSDQLLQDIEEILNVDSLNDKLTSAILEAAISSIPKGCQKKYKPFWNAEIQEAVSSRESARTELEENASAQSKTTYNKRNAQVKRVVATSKRSKWYKSCARLDLARGGAKAWSLFNNLSGDHRKVNPKVNPKPIRTEEGCIADDQKKAESFNKFFASVNRANKRAQDKEKLQELKELEKASKVKEPTFEEEFTIRELQKAVKKLKPRKSPGKDKIHNEMIARLGHEGKKTLLKLINLSFKTGQIPKAWRIATITPLLKKGKETDDMKNYRPISLTSCIGKLAERMVNHRLYWWLESTGLLNSSQAGFRAGNRTDDQLFRLSQRVLDGFQTKQHTTAVFVDLQQAYDKVWRKGLLLKMMKLGIHGCIYKWIKSFLTDRTILTRVNNAFSSQEVLEEGLPQGSSLSCTLFLVYINDLPDILKTEKALYADDLVIWHTSQHPLLSARRLNEELSAIEKYCDEWKLKVNCQKTVYSIFTNSNKVAKKNLNIIFKETPLLKEENPTYLGVELDAKMKLNNHMKNLEEKAKKRTVR